MPRNYNSRGENVWTPHDQDCNNCISLANRPRWQRRLLYTLRYTGFTAGIVGAAGITALGDIYLHEHSSDRGERQIEASMEKASGSDKVLTLEEKTNMLRNLGYNGIISNETALQAIEYMAERNPRIYIIKSSGANEKRLFEVPQQAIAQYLNKR